MRVCALVVLTSLVGLANLARAEVQVFCEVSDAIAILSGPGGIRYVPFSSVGPLAIQVAIYNASGMDLELGGPIEEVVAIDVRSGGQSVRGSQSIRSLIFGNPTSNKFESLPQLGNTGLVLEPRASLELEIRWWDGAHGVPL